MDLGAWWREQLGPIRWKADGNGMARCPWHEDRRASLSVHRETGLWYCFAGCGGGTVGDFARRRGGAPPRSTAEAAEAVYDYRDETGALLYQVVRFPGKQFRQRRPIGAGDWVWKLTGVRRVLYRLPELLAGGDPVYIVEGEKDVETLRAAGLTATTSPGGAGKWRPEYSPLLRDRVCVLLPDNDEPGRAHMAAVARALDPYAAEVLRVEVPGLPEKGDVSDWLAAGRTVGELSALVEAARDARPGPEASGGVEAPRAAAGAWPAGPAPPGGLRELIPTRGWLAEYVEYGCAVTDAPLSFHVFGGLTCVVVTLGRRVWFPYASRALYPNLYVCLLGASGLTRKSTVVGIAREVLDRFDEHAILPDQASAERFYELLAGHPASLGLWPEFGAALGYMERSYMVGMKADLTHLYDCPPVFRRALKSGTVEVKAPALSILTASTPEWLFAHMGEVDLRGGFFPRFLYVVPDAARPRVALPLGGDAQRLNALVKGLQQIKERAGAYALVDGRAEYEAWDAGVAQELRAVGEVELYGVFLARLPAHALKLACCLHALDSDAPALGLEALRRALGLADWLRATLREHARDSLALTPKQRERARVLALIRAEPGIVRRELLRRSRLLSKELEEHVGTLLEGGRVRSEGQGARGNPLRYWAEVEA